MDTLALLLVIAGLLLMAFGAYLVFRPPPSATTGKPEALPEIDEIIKQIKELLLVFEQNVRAGMAVMIMGLILVSLGIFLEVRDTKDEVKEQPTATAALIRHGS